ncbi:MAG: FAD-binding oxidoreductase [Gammaproteobacteria bacterium]|nr:FAD-binding oxidoreductase [Gammaproteobacteria bacterium]MDH5629004.1 FAD-binding oxidoreductase [Gammaproteobacteria bacterium]
MLFNDNHIEPLKDESVLDALIRHQHDVSYSCKIGHCQTCLLKCREGTISQQAQVGLKATDVNQGFFLSCQQPADSIKNAEHIDTKSLFVSAKVIGKKLCSKDVCRLRLELPTQMYYHAGQFINLKNKHGVSRSYSLASVPQLDRYLELHIRLMENGEMSYWIFDTLEVGEYIEIQGPIGSCFYTEINKQFNIVLIGTGTGAAPLYGIARDALNAAHEGKIIFYHGVKHNSDLYLDSELNNLQLINKNFSYEPCTTQEINPKGLSGRCNDIALENITNVNSTILYICGNPEMVADTKKRAYLKGISLDKIFTDPFDRKELRSKKRE